MLQREDKWPLQLATRVVVSSLNMRVAVSHGVIATSRDCRELAVYFDFWMSLG
jgi:hypothetical protein